MNTGPNSTYITIVSLIAIAVVAGGIVAKVGEWIGVW